MKMHHRFSAPLCLLSLVASLILLTLLHTHPVIATSSTSTTLDASLDQLHSTSQSTSFPLSTLLEHTSIASSRWAPTPRSRLERMQQLESKQPGTPEPLGARTAQLTNANAKTRGSPIDDNTGNQQELRGKLKEPIAPKDTFAGAIPPRERRAAASGPPARQPARESGSTDPPPPPGPKFAPEVPASSGNEIPLPPMPKPEHKPYPPSPPGELPLASPPQPDCGELCSPRAADPILAQVPSAPLDDLAIAEVGLEGTVLSKVLQKIHNRAGWLRAQKLWLSKAHEAASTIRREIELAEFTRDAVASDLDQLKQAQDALSIKYKADRLKWSYKDKKITIEALHERLEELEHAKADVSNQLKIAKDEVTVLKNTLGPPSGQVQITPNELEDPLKFLDDVMIEHQMSSYD